MSDEIFFPNRESFSPNVCIKIMADPLLCGALVSQPCWWLSGSALECGQVLRASHFTSCTADSCVPPVLMQKPSQCSFCPPFSQAVCEKEKNTFSFSPQAQAIKVALALECSCPSSKAFKHVINPSSFSNVQTQLSFTKCDLGVYSDKGILVSAWVGKVGQLIWNLERAMGKGRQTSIGIEAESTKRTKSQSLTQKSSLLFYLWLQCHFLQMTSLYY